MMDLAAQLALEREKNARLQAEVDRLRKAVVLASLEAEKEEEYIVNQFIRRMEQKQKAANSNKLRLRRIERSPPRDYEAEMKRLRDEKVALGVRFEQEQESMVNRLVRQLKGSAKVVRRGVPSFGLAA
ncbi:Aste57867_126 [Aphanomyces stellatus]|uniref:Aste57867_126 protein n=1 Tax=Aphanomyces stellatus TaxID=120398 RepID=A0A485K212_9STRA|nr:hypothetical protein As57867_000126 [Aphanomyces stellatus]VFT77352.1 Aste57867_126 [Aphanomyces stellatus]